MSPQTQEPTSSRNTIFVAAPADVLDEKKSSITIPIPTSQETNSNPSPDQAPTLSTLPPELHLKIFDTLEQHKRGAEMSACLGLTCKTFYPLFFARHAKVPLRRVCGSGCSYWRDPLTYGHSNTRSTRFFLFRPCIECAARCKEREELYQLLVEWLPENLEFVPGHWAKDNKFGRREGGLFNDPVEKAWRKELYYDLMEWKGSDIGE